MTDSIHWRIQPMDLWRGASSRRSGRISRTPRPVVTRSSKSRPARPFVADEGQPGPQRIGAAGVREQCCGYFAFADLRAGLETAWETALQAVAEAQAELARRQALRPKTLTSAERAAILVLGDDLHQIWDAPATTDKDRKQLLHTLLDEVNITVHRDHSQGHADLVLRWKGGALSELTTPPSASHQRPAPMRTPSAWSAA